MGARVSLAGWGGRAFESDRVFRARGIPGLLGAKVIVTSSAIVVRSSLGRRTEYPLCDIVGCGFNRPSRGDAVEVIEEADPRLWAFVFLVSVAMAIAGRSLAKPVLHLYTAGGTMIPLPMLWMGSLARTRERASRARSAIDVAISRYRKLHKAPPSSVVQSPSQTQTLPLFAPEVTWVQPPVHLMPELAKARIEQQDRG